MRMKGRNVRVKEIGTMSKKPANKSDKVWDKISVPGVTDNMAYALEITGDAMLPVYREGDIIIVSPDRKSVV